MNIGRAALRGTCLRSGSWAGSSADDLHTRGQSGADAGYLHPVPLGFVLGLLFGAVIGLARR